MNTDPDFLQLLENITEIRFLDCVYLTHVYSYLLE